MSSVLSDTNPQALKFQIELLREASPLKRLEGYKQLYRSVRRLTYLGLRDRFPNDSPERLDRRLADHLLGAELAEKVYGPLPQ